MEKLQYYTYMIYFLLNDLVSEIYDGVNNLYRYCKNYNVKLSNENSLEQFARACIDNDLKKMKEIYSNTEVELPLNDALANASCKGETQIVEWLLEVGATDLDSALRESCLNNRFNTSELLVQKGANTTVGLRYSKSPNITRMLYRYKQNTQMIN